MAPTPTTDNSTSTNQGGGGDDARVSLIIAITALAISSLLAAMQLLFSYVTAATVRNKTNTAALGGWSRHTKYSVRDFWKGKLHVTYGVMELSQESFVKDYLKRSLRRSDDMRHLEGYSLQTQLEIQKTKNGSVIVGQKLNVVRADGHDKRTEVPMSELTLTQRAALNRIQSARRKKQPSPSVASWVTLSQHLGCEFDTFVPERWADADRIPMACGAPLMTIRLSDMIAIGYLLDMSLREPDPTTGQLLMTGNQCKIYSEHLPNVGLVSRYDVKAHDFSPTLEQCGGLEPDVLMDTARGMVGYSETATDWGLLGYNSVDSLMDLFLERAEGNGWQALPLDKARRTLVIRGDKEPCWNKKWSEPQTDLVAFILASMCAPAVAKAFPHKLIAPWVKLGPQGLTLKATAALREAGYTLVTPSDDFIPNMFQKSYLKSSAYKVTDNYGCELGGRRGYLSTNLAQFTTQAASCWTWSSTPEYRAKPPIPILSELIDRFEAGKLLNNWDLDEYRGISTGDHWTFTPRAALWLQVTMLDTWIGYMIDQLMEATALREVPLPAEVSEAEACATAAAKLERQSHAFNPVRGRWLKIYLLRLAEGHDGQGDSFMSSNPRSDLTERWQDMEKGTPSQWLALDAVLTLRAATMHAMLMQLDDSSVLLNLKYNDPLIYLS